MDRTMTIQEKIGFMGPFKTGELIESIKKTETEYEEVLREQSKFMIDKGAYVSGTRGANSEAVKRIEADLTMEIPETINNKKATADDKKAWLARQKTENKELADAYQNQRMADIVAADFEIKVKMNEVRIANIRAIMSFRASQFAFFAGNVRIEVEDKEEGEV